MGLKIQRRSSVPTDVIRQYRHRILSLEVELQELARNGSLGRRQVRLSLQRLRHLKALLSTLQSMRSITKPQPPEELKTPDFDLCGVQAQNLCVKWSQDYTLHVKAQAEQTSKISAWVRKTLAGEGLGWLAVLRLSKLRRMLAGLEGKIIEAEHDYRQLEIAAQSLQKGGLTRQPVDVLAKIYQDICKQDEHIERLEYQIQADVDHTAWMQRWLVIQEERLKTYFPVVSRNIQLEHKGGS